MVKDKRKVRALAKLANEKPKAFMKNIAQKFPAVTDLEERAGIASKVLFYSRMVNIDFIAEALGGKDEQAKLLMDAYLSKIDFSEDDIE